MARKRKSAARGGMSLVGRGRMTEGEKSSLAFVYVAFYAPKSVRRGATHDAIYEQYPYDMADIERLVRRGLVAKIGKRIELTPQGKAVARMILGLTGRKRGRRQNPAEKLEVGDVVTALPGRMRGVVMRVRRHPSETRLDKVTVQWESGSTKMHAAQTLRKAPCDRNPAGTWYAYEVGMVGYDGRIISGLGTISGPPGVPLSQLRQEAHREFDIPIKRVKLRAMLVPGARWT